MAISWLDLLVVVAYLAAITIFGARFRHRQKTLRDFFLGGRRLPWWAISFAIVTAETSILTIISTPGIAYHSNLGFLQLVFGYLVGRVVVSLALIPRYFAGEMFTAYQLIEQRFGRVLKVFTGALFLTTRALAEGVRVFAIAIVIGVIFKSGVFTSLLIVTALTLFYTFEGGLTAVIWTEVIQLLIYLTGTAVALALALHAIPGGWAEVARLAHAEGNKLAVFDFHFNWHEPYLFWSGLVGGAFLNTASHGTDQLIVQLLLAARKRRESQAALLSSGLVILLQFTLFLVVGVALFAFYTHFPPPHAFSRADQIFPAFVVTQLPRGLAGLLIAAIIATGMANLSAAFNSLASSSVMDFYKPFVRPNAGEKHYLAVSRGMVLVWGGVLVVIALLVQQLQRSALELALTVASVPYGSMLGIFLLGVMTKRANGRGALTGALVALAVMVFVVAYSSLAWTWYVALGTVVTFTVGWVASLRRE
ncbi:MAG TPA: sodium:solute symporter [Terriglobia bacterium]|nr:sodium:solute symporter [Terriglobia bacterium]